MLNMKKQILSIAIALPVLMASAAASASEVVKISPVTTAPVLSKPAIRDGSLINSIQKLGDNINKPGEGVRGPKPGKGPPSSEGYFAKSARNYST